MNPVDRKEAGKLQLHFDGGQDIKQISSVTKITERKDKSALTNAIQEFAK